MYDKCVSLDVSALLKYLSIFTVYKNFSGK